MNITLDLTKKLIATQFPEYEGLTVTEVEKQGHDNRTYRIGKELLIRMPIDHNYALKVPIENEILPELAKNLSIPIPKPIKMGAPTDYYPYHFSIYEWIEGTSLNHSSLNEPEINKLAIDLALFLNDLRKTSITQKVKPGQHNWWRGAHPSVYDRDTHQQIDKLKTYIDHKQALSLWNKACKTKWDKAPVWIHGDYAPGNILIKNGKLNGVIDFGCTAQGDPACDLTIAWTYFSGKSRDAFIEIINLDENTWLRARAWALWKATFELCNNQNINSGYSLIQKQLIHDLLTI